MTTYAAQTGSDLLDQLGKAADGDTISLTGQFGEVTLTGIRPKGRIVITAAEPGAAHFERITLKNCANLSLRGLTCWPLSVLPPKKAKQYLITGDPRSANIEITECLFRGRADSDKHPTWSKTDWHAAKIGGVFLRGPRGVVRHCAAVGVQFGYSIGGRSSELFENIVFGFSGDGLRVTEDNCVVIGNRVTDAVQIDGNHSDAFQCFKTSGLLNGLVVKDNALLEWTVRPDNPLRAKMQGLSLHNGPYANVVVRGNSITSSTANGIRLHAVENVEVIGNRVRNADGRRGNHPWIQLLSCSGQIVVQNNEAESFKMPRQAQAAGNREPDYSVRY